MMPHSTTAPAPFPTARCANAISASVPPSPRLSARSRMSTYFSVTTTISAHRISESTPSTAARVMSPSLPTEAVTAAVGKDGDMTRAAVLGVLSLILWALIVVVTLKYVLILLRADNRGEGGTLALMALAQRAVGKGAGAVVLCGIISAALFYGDAMITPALSVLSAIEGLKVVTTAFDHYIVLLTVVIIAGLF